MGTNVSSKDVLHIGETFIVVMYSSNKQPFLRYQRKCVKPEIIQTISALYKLDLKPVKLATELPICVIHCLLGNGKSIFMNETLVNESWVAPTSTT